MINCEYFITIEHVLIVTIGFRRYALPHMMTESNSEQTVVTVKISSLCEAKRTYEAQLATAYSCLQRSRTACRLLWTQTVRRHEYPSQPDEEPREA